MDETGLQRADNAAEVPTLEISTKLKLSQAQIMARCVRERAMAAWSNLAVDVEPFTARILAWLEPHADAKAALDALAIEDLFLAHACCTGSAVALATFANEYESE